MFGGHKKLPRDGDSGLSLAGVHHGEKVEEGCSGRWNGMCKGPEACDQPEGRCV